MFRRHSLALKLSPSPTAFGEAAWLEWLGNEQATLRVSDLSGRVLEEKNLAPNTSSATLQASWPPGVYQLEIRTVSGKRAVRPWVIR
ncbi:MAG: T9SS type A sorting domain-containing protein [Saprospiraceae bacterium]